MAIAFYTLLKSKPIFLFVEEFTDYDSVVVFSAVGCVRIEQNFSSFPIDTCLVGRNAISKNANNVVVSSPRVVMFSHNLSLIHI